MRKVRRDDVPEWQVDVGNISKNVERMWLLEFVTRILLPVIAPIITFLIFVVILWWEWK